MYALANEPTGCPNFATRGHTRTDYQVIQRDPTPKATGTIGHHTPFALHTEWLSCGCKVEASHAETGVLRTAAD